MSAILAFFTQPGALAAILGVLLAISELMAFLPIKSSGILDVVINVVKSLVAAQQPPAAK